MTDTVRHRLIPTRGAPSWYVQGQEEALRSAHDHFASTDIPVMVCSAPEGGVVKQITVVGGGKVKRRT